ncbi:signal transduction histidine kinase [Motilibacter peucedani]|uniref:Signal transduction histidine kinase n=1 Tax=Motilibacter peucedani TaxID=598650 RepID=A0A420XQN4_9ACTN|nr:signal transduction histidine kinase [Motilibacter peucedani]
MLWRAVAAYRVVAWVYAVVLLARADGDYAHPLGAWLVLAALGAWSAVAPLAYAVRRGPALGIDLAAALGSIAVTGVLDTHERVVSGAQTLPVVWPAAAVISWGLALGWAGGLGSAVAVGVVGVLERGELAQQTVHNAVLLCVTGSILGYAASIQREAQRQLSSARAAEAALAERERLGRVVHDGVLQVLALTARRAATADDPDLTALAAEAEAQERALRRLVSGVVGASSATGTDLAARLAALASDDVDVAVPPVAVQVCPAVADELEAAVRAALDNVRVHAGPGAHAWLLLEETAEEVVVSVRDDGPGFAPGRLDEAEQAGRMGVRSSIVGRLRDLGGSARIEAAPGFGTEVELVVPKAAR